MGTTTRTITLLGVGFLILIVAFVLLRPSDSAGPRPSPSGAASSGPEQPSAAATEPLASSKPASPEPSGSTGDIAVLVGAGDIAECDGDHDADTAGLVEGIAGIVFTLGDNAYERGTLQEFQECYGPTWGRPSIRNRTMPVAGNHEYETARAAGYFQYFGAVAGDPDEGWYAYDAGAWRIYALNSNCGEIGGCESGSAQERWLRKDIVANPRACVAAMWHHPRFSSGEHGNNESMAELWRTLQEADSELVLAGHDHSYERFGPQDASGRADEGGLVELVVGTGGRDPYPFRTPEPNSLVRESPVFGVLRLELRPDGYDFAFLAVPGDDFTDGGSGTCH